MASFNTFKVLDPTFKETYAQKKLKQPKLAKPNLKMGKKSKVVMPGTGSGGY